MPRRALSPIRALLAASLLLGLPAAADAQTRAEAAGPSEAWNDLAAALFPGRAIADAGAMIAIDAPFRAHDAATVPIEIAIAPPEGRSVERFTIVIDENPAPVAAQIDVGPGLGRDVALSTRVRVDAYSAIRVVAELDDGSVAQSGVFVRASGGCAAPGMKDADAALAAAGQMRLRVFSGPEPEAQLMIRHPNNSGFQVDQVSLLHIPPWFIDLIEVRQGDELVMRVSGGISLSEDPSLRFRYVPNGADAFAVRVEDTERGVFAASFPSAGS
ncbi:MAG: quinoprotein dehydrogenase-associated SoxYZ-like carrier [Rhodobacteraceae bacterium]|nr:MAG: quinoprotein dehydrogenase-associated SoxYZ-like carrier [Paracoccaceae bacterium]